ncbi:MAG TPA: hypothetical protein VM286_01155 [Candidatus Thermoplasmatota archaeon]|nr:hypothetical protein [Candidatus Thermoplasmatota archaeon]
MARSAALFALLLLTGLAAPALAQAPTPLDPVVTLSLKGPVQGVNAPLGSGQDISLQAALDATNTVCPSPSKVTVTLRVEVVQGTGVTATLPASIEVELPATAGTSGPGPDGLAHTQGATSVPLHVAVARSANSSSSVLRVTASVPGGIPSGCQAPNADKVAAQDRTIEVGLLTDIDQGLNGTGGTQASCTFGGSATHDGISCPQAPRPAFFLPLEAQLLVLLGAGLFRRRASV